MDKLIPHDLAHSVNHELLNVITLLRAAIHETGAGPDERDDPMTCPTSRAVALIGMADDKVRGVLSAITDYV